MSDTNAPPKLFDGRRFKAHLDRAKAKSVSGADFLYERASGDMIDRLSVTNREFENALDVFSLTEKMISDLQNQQNVMQCGRLAADYCFVNENLGLKPGSIDLAMSVFGLHWMNNLPGAMAQIATALRPDGLFLATLPGDGTLAELRDCLMTAEAELTGGASMRVDPFPDIRQAGNLLQRAGLKLPVTDIDPVTVRYSSMFELVRDLRGMAATSLLVSNRHFSNRNLFKRANEIYLEKYNDSDGRIRATFNIIHLSGWREHESQQKPLKPGSAEQSLAKFLK